MQQTLQEVGQNITRWLCCFEDSFLFVCVCQCGYPKRSGEDMGCWKLNVGPLEEQVALLTTEQLPKAGFTN